MFLLISFACSSDALEPIEYFSQEVASFALEDVNESSNTYGAMIATTDFPEKISAWYFGHST